MNGVRGMRRIGSTLQPRQLPLRVAIPDAGRTLITGGAGFIGSNLADRLLSMGQRVTILDDCSRPGVERNLHWLRSRHERLLTVEIADVRDAAAVRRAVAPVDAVFHFAAQVAVTTSLIDPAADFEVNARGTLNVLEAIRARTHRPVAIMTSTNKVYGALGDIALEDGGKRWLPADAHLRATGIGENRPLDFQSPYGCSKGAADQYTLDYARSYGLDTAVLRMSCIYGPRQFGTEDQGWVAHFMIRALEGRPITIFGDGKQVRDVLYVQDLLDALLLARTEMDQLRGRVFNIGGGVGNAVSLLELVDLITELHGERPGVTFEPRRTGDQRYYVADPSRLTRAVGWTPRTSVRDGTERLYFWMLEHGIARARALTATAGDGRAPERHP
jgi:CDP-paratose 2-epimerase